MLAVAFANPLWAVTRTVAQGVARADELARAQAACQRLIGDIGESGDYACSDAEWARACSDDIDVVRAECRSWSAAALAVEWTVPAEALIVAGLDGPDGGAERTAAQIPAR